MSIKLHLIGQFTRGYGLNLAMKLIDNRWMLPKRDRNNRLKNVDDKDKMDLSMWKCVFTQREAVNVAWSMPRVARFNEALFKSLLKYLYLGWRLRQRKVLLALATTSAKFFVQSQSRGKQSALSKPRAPRIGPILSYSSGPNKLSSSWVFYMNRQL